MKDTRLVMGMPIEVEIVSDDAEAALEDAFAYFTLIDERFSPFKEESEVSRLNRGEIGAKDASEDLRHILMLTERAREATGGFFDATRPDGRFDPSGVVKGWAIAQAAARIRAAGFEDFFVNAGGDIASSGVNERGEAWSVGVRNPFATAEIVKVLYPKGRGVATSGSYERGAHIYNPLSPAEPLEDVVSITVIGPDVLAADTFATAAFAMGKEGVSFIESKPGFEAYQIGKDGVATMTSGFAAYTC